MEFIIQKQTTYGFEGFTAPQVKNEQADKNIDKWSFDKGISAYRRKVLLSRQGKNKGISEIFKAAPGCGEKSTFQAWVTSGLRSLLSDTEPHLPRPTPHRHGSAIPGAARITYESTHTGFGSIRVVDSRKRGHGSFHLDFKRCHREPQES